MLAGRIEEFVHVFYQAHRQPGTSFWYNTGGARAAADVLCLDANGELEQAVSLENKARPDLNTPYKALGNLQSGGAHTSATNCKLQNGENTKNVYLNSQTNNLQIKWGGGLFTTPNSDRVIASTDWEPNGKAGVTAGIYKECENSIAAFDRTAEAAEAETQLLIKLEGDEAPTLGPKEIAKDEFHKDIPKNKLTITVADLKTVHEKLHRFRKSHNKEEENLRGARLHFLQQQLQLNKTTCELGVKHTSKDYCEVTDTEPPKCDGKEQ
uniref:Variant surface glycoprotein 1125.2992 n=1 Tax=Trypanosoma brucei TaxID=5691 RepID=A0A1J0R9B6_9TRYP|nr:variant surface glycoprotein 1125.2992 [Trypanosoma brucei]